MHQPTHTSIILNLERGGCSFSSIKQRVSLTPLLEDDWAGGMAECLVPKKLADGWVGSHLVVFDEGSAFGDQGLSAAELPYPRLAWVNPGSARLLTRELHRWLHLGGAPRALCIPSVFTQVVVFMAAMMGTRHGHVITRRPQLQGMLDAAVGLVSVEEAMSLVQYSPQRSFNAFFALSPFTRSVRVVNMKCSISQYSKHGVECANFTFLALASCVTSFQNPERLATSVSITAQT